MPTLSGSLASRDSPVALTKFTAVSLGIGERCTQVCLDGKCVLTGVVLNKLSHV